MVLDREEQDIRKKMCEGDWISQVGPMVHATGVLGRAADGSSERTGLAGVQGYPHCPKTEGQMETGGLTRAGQYQEVARGGACGKECCGGGSDQLASAGEGRYAQLVFPTSEGARPRGLELGEEKW